MQKFYKLSLLLLVFGCASTVGPSSINQPFNEKFSKTVGQINSIRREENINDFKIEDFIERKEVGNAQFEDPATIFAKNAPINNSAKFDTSKLKMPEQKYYTPDANTLALGLQNFAPTQISSQIFKMHYNTNPHPPFRITGAEFDAIKIPEIDKNGVKSNLEDKQYLLAGNDILQRSLDEYDKKRQKEDVEMSLYLIKEKKELQRQKKMQQLYGIEEKQEIVAENDDWQKIKKEKRNDAIRKIIASQIVAQNLYKNRPEKLEQNQQQ